MLELFGRGYVIEHCVSALNSLRKSEAYQIYTAELLHGIAQSLGVQAIPFMEYLDALKPHKQEERSSEEVIDSIRKKAQKIKGGDN